MILNDNLFSHFEEKAKAVKIDSVCLGLGYTAVTTKDGGIGLSFTYFKNKSSCMVNKNYMDYEGEASITLLAEIKSADPIRRSMALALVNALNYEEALLLPEDSKKSILFDAFQIEEGTQVAMVGMFAPMMNSFKERGAQLEVMDDHRQIGSKDNFYSYLEEVADVLVLTSTSILNGTTEEILEHTGEKVKTVMLGPSTPMVALPFHHLPIHMLAGTVPLEKENVLKAVRHGAGTPVIQKYSRKSYIMISSFC